MRPRMYGSTDMNVLRTTSSPSAGSATSVSATAKSDGWGAPTGREASLISPLVKGIVGHARDLNAVVVEDRSAAHVGVALLDGRVDVRAAAHVLEPVALGRGDHARPDAVRDDHLRLEASAGIVDAGTVAGPKPAARRALRVELDARAAVLLHQVGLVREHRVQEPVTGGRDQRERGVPGLCGRHVARERVMAVGLGLGAEELELAGRRGEALGERDERGRVVEPHRALLVEALVVGVAEQR